MEHKIEKSPEDVAKRISEQVGNSVEIIKKEDTFDFKCQRCGQCCVGRSDIVLSSFDIYDGAKYLGITCQEFVDKYVKIILGHNSKLPVLTLKVDDRGWCPFLKFDIKAGGLFGCTINDAKPGACRNHPIGVATSFKKEDNGTETVSEFYIKVEQCDNSQGHNNPVKVEDWMQRTEQLKEEREWSHRLQTTPISEMEIKKFYTLFGINSIPPADFDQWKEEDKEVVKEVMQNSKEALKGLFDAIVSLTYVNFETDKPFVEQAQANATELGKICSKCNELYKTALEVFIEAGGTEEMLNMEW